MTESQQGDLWSHSRATDPPSSHEAVAKIGAEGLNRQRSLVLWAIHQCESNEPHKIGATAGEIVMRLAYTGTAPQQSVVSKRCTDLRRLDLIEATDQIRNGQHAHRLTDTGRAAVAELER